MPCGPKPQRSRKAFKSYEPGFLHVDVKYLPQMADEATRGILPKNLPRVDLVVEPEASVCGCGGGLHQIGEDVRSALT